MIKTHTDLFYLVGGREEHIITMHVRGEKKEKRNDPFVKMSNFNPPKQKILRNVDQVFG